MTTVNLAMDLNSIVAGKAGERHGNNESAGSHGDFDKALTAKSTTKRTQPMQHSDRAATGFRALIQSIAAEDIQAADLPPDDDGALSSKKITIQALDTPEQDVPETPPDETSGEIGAEISEAVTEMLAPPSLPHRAKESEPTSAASTGVAPDGGPTTAPRDRGVETSRTGNANMSVAGGTATAMIELPEKAEPSLAQSSSSTQQRTQSAGTALDGQRVAMAMSGDQNSDATQPRISVLGFSTSPAPAQSSTTSSGLVAALDADPAWRAAAEAATGITNPRGLAHYHGVSSLRIQLNPVELGMVTARLVATDNQLQVEIKVESNDARQRLANDSDAIVKALRAIGYEVDRVTIQQAPQSSSATNQQSGQGRDSPMQEQTRQQAGENGGGRNGQDGAGDNNRAAKNAAGAVVRERSGGGVYI